MFALSFICYFIFKCVTFKYMNTFVDQYPIKKYFFPTRHMGVRTDIKGSVHSTWAFTV